MDAPLSSPSLNSSRQHPGFPNTYFAHSTSSSSTASANSSAPTSAPQQQQSQAAPQTAAPQQPLQQQRPPIRSGDNTSPFLQDFNLVAEAAKRAQMAVLMRDLESCGL